MFIIGIRKKQYLLVPIFNSKERERTTNMQILIILLIIAYRPLGVILQLAAGFGAGINHKGRGRRRRW